MRRIILLLSVLTLMIFQVEAKHKIAERYLIQELVKNTGPNRIYVAPYLFKSYFEYYFVEEQDLIDFIRKDSVDFSKLILTFENNMSFSYSDTNLNSTNHYNRLIDLDDILHLDDNEIYNIGGRVFVLKKMKYAYLDNISKVYTDNDKLLTIIYGDDIESSEDDGKIVEVDTKKYFDKDEFEVFLYMIEQKPTSPNIKTKLWLKRYQMFELSKEWYNNRMK